MKSLRLRLVFGLVLLAATFTASGCGPKRDDPVQGSPLASLPAAQAPAVAAL